MKQKTRKAAKKRAKVTKGGKGEIILQKASQNHLLVNKSKKAKREDSVAVSPHRKKSFRRMLGL